VIFVAKKDMTTNVILHLFLVAGFGSGIRDPGWVKIRIRDKHSGSATLQTRKKSMPSVWRKDICRHYGIIHKIKKNFLYRETSHVIGQERCAARLKTEIGG
jgi:hypothetical protein